ncbi:MAG: filamentous hemagglutinin N-terminal domain-containing protein, partial [Planctomycetes bacterium]|nr:filamentous hemagglutinin N-terminal domain-containing protein [Planctomycetota bacterium]
MKELMVTGNTLNRSFGLSWLRASLNVAAFACASLLVITNLADAGIHGQRTVRGSATFSQEGNRLIVRASNGAIIEYDRLSIEAGQIMQFIQPSSTSRVLNRVTGSELSRIDGTLLSNGIVYLVNPQGFRIGNGAVINVGGFFAAAGAMSNSDFAGGRDRFTNLAGEVTNEGMIHAKSVALVGQYVANHGTIDVDNGIVAMAAGDSVYLQKGTGPVMVTVSRSQLGADGSGAGTQAAVSNTGTINAGKGSVSMASGDFYALAMDLSGTIIGKSIAARGGKDGVVAVNGTLDASSSTGKGGTVDIFGDRVGLFGNALVNANGATGGGSVRIGGDYLGTNAANAPQANRTVIGTDARITANATQSGNGGRVIVWSNEYT